MMFYKENNKMKITKDQLKQIIKEEIESIMASRISEETLEEKTDDEQPLTPDATVKEK